MRIAKDHGAAFVALIVSVYVGCKGIAASLLSASMLPYFKTHLRLSNYEYQVCLTVVMLPWALKSLLGLLADRVQLGGNGSQTYFLMAVLVGTACATAMAALPNLETSGTYTILGLAFGVSFQVACTDLLSEGNYARKMAQKPDGATAVLSAVWWAMSIGSLAGVVIAGVCSGGHIRAAFAIVAVACAQCIVPWYSGSFALPPGTVAGPRADIDGLVLVCFTVSGAAVAASVATVFASTTVQLAVSMLCLGAALAVNFWKLPRTLACCNAYMFLANVLNFNFSGAIDYWYTAPPHCVQGGPAFSVQYYIAVGGIVGAVFSMVGVEVYKRTLSKWPAQKVFQLTALLRCAAAAVDVVIINRWNVSAGISDKVAFVLGKAMLDPVILALDAMPMVALTAKLCPEGNETSVYALLASYQNFGASLAAVLGMATAAFADVHLADADAVCTYDALPTLLVACNMLLPLVCVPLAFMLPSRE